LAALWRLAFSAQKLPRAESRLRQAAAHRDFAVCQRKNRPAGGSLWNPDEAGSSGKKASRKLNYIDTEKTAELRHLLSKIVFVQTLNFVSAVQHRANRGKSLAFHTGFADTKNPPPATRRVILSELGRA
jgi:hypothetical protein